MKSNEYLGALRSALMGLGAGIVLLLAGTLMALRMADPQGMLTAIAYGALVLGGALCGFFQGRTGDSLSMLALAAGIYGGTLLAVSLIFGGFRALGMKLAVYGLMSLIALLIGWITPSAGRKRRYRYK